MATYAIVLLGCCFLLVSTFGSTYRYKKSISLLCIVPLTIFAAVRGYVGTDTYSYHRMLIDYGGEDLVDITKLVEPFFALLIKLSDIVSGNSFFFVASIAIVQGLILARLVSTSKNPAYFLLIYISVFYLSFQFNILRAGTSILLLVLANRTPKNSPDNYFFYIAGLLAVSMHYSALIGFIPMIMIRQTRLSTGSVVMMLAALSLILVYFAISDTEYIYLKYLTYADLLNLDPLYSISMSLILSLPLYFMLYVSSAKKGALFGLTSLFVIWLILRWLTSIFTLVGRVEVIINALLLFTIIEGELVGWRRKVRSIALIGLTVMWLYIGLTSLRDEEDIMSKSAVLDELHLMSPYTPYKFFWNED